MSDWLRIAALPLLVVAIIIRRAEREAVTALESSGALTESTSIELPPSNRLGRWQIGRLEAAGAIRASAASLYYFVPSAYGSFRDRRRRRAAIIVSTLMLLALVSWYLSR